MLLSSIFTDYKLWHGNEKWWNSIKNWLNNVVRFFCCAVKTIKKRCNHQIYRLFHIKIAIAKKNLMILQHSMAFSTSPPQKRIIPSMDWVIRSKIVYIHKENFISNGFWSIAQKNNGLKNEWINRPRHGMNNGNTTHTHTHTTNCLWIWIEGLVKMKQQQSHG